MVTLNTNDLSHILEQIRIAEAHAAGTPLAQLIASPLLPDGLRTVDGSFNNFQQGMERFGAADEPMKRLLDIQLATAELAPNRPGMPPSTVPTSYAQTSGNVYDSQPRVISNLVADQSLNNPAAIAAALSVNGIVGAQQLQIVQQIMLAQAAARAAQAAIDLAEANADAAQAAAQAVVDSALSAENDAQAQLDDANAALATSQAALADAEAAFNAAQAALDALPVPSADIAALVQGVQVATAEFDAAVAMAQQATAALQTAQTALSDAQAELLLLEAARDAAFDANSAAETVRVDAQAALDLALIAQAEANIGFDPNGVTDAALLVVERQLGVTSASDAAALSAGDLAVAVAAVAAQAVVVSDAEALVTQRQAESVAADAFAVQTQADLDRETQELADAQTVLALVEADPLLEAAFGEQARATALQAQQEYDAALIADEQADLDAAAATSTLLDAQATLSSAQVELSLLEAALLVVQTANDEAQLALLAAQDQLASAEAALAVATEQAELVANADAAVVLAETALLDAQSSADVAEQALADAEAARAAQQVIVDDAAQALANADAAQQAADANLATETAELSAAQVALDAANSDLAVYAAALQQVSDTATALAEAQAGFDQSTADVGAAEVVLAAASDARIQAEADLATIPTGEEAIAAAEALADQANEAVTALVASHGIEMDGDNVFIKNIAADLGDTASFNGFMTIFGQFFDHGLDLTTKGGAGTVYIPLQPDDPLYVEGSPTNFMVLTRATNQPGADNILGTADDVREHANLTTPWVDLNQLYTSNASHQVFLREFVLVDGKPVATGMMLEGETGGPPRWADIKTQAREVLGIELSDLNVHSVPGLVTDEYGNFLPGENGFPQLMTPTGPVEGNLSDPVDAMEAVSAGRAFLDDIAHNAVPGTYVVDRFTGETAFKLPDADSDTGNAIIPNQFGQNATYDNELLDRHYIVGDGRGNENIALTSIHTVFHGEHNRQIEEIKATLLAEGNVDFLNEWLSVPVTEVPADPALLSWDGARLFQAARFSTEMVYQHLVFEEFVRAISPQIDPFVFSNSVTIDGAIFEEFAQVIYRFGHSMLTEQVGMLKLMEGEANYEEVGLIEAFLNPVLFDAQGMTAEESAGAILRGMTRQAGNEIDEFTTSALRDNLVGLPLDLAALNMARARETGVPSLNEARRQIFEQTNDTFLKPYESWTDYAGNLKNPLSVVNFIAAYGTHESIMAATTVVEKRDAAWALVFGGEDAPADRLDYVNGTGTWAGVETGLNKVDFWIGGLAEALMPFGGMLGSTFNFVFELQIENLQAGDRFYYLSRTQGMNLLTQLESDSFADLVRRNTDTEHTGIHINGAAFQTADYVIEMDQSKQYNTGLGNLDPTREDDVLAALQGNTDLVIRRDTDNDGDIDYIRFTGGEHVVLGGTSENDTLVGGAGDDAIWGEDGDDSIEGGLGVDHIHGGRGNDIITDAGTDIGAADVIKGEEGDDIINAGMGLDLVFGGDGSDVLAGGSEMKDTFGGAGNDFIRAASGGGGIYYGNEGDDWMEGQGFMNTLTGDNSELFFNSRVIGHDVMHSGENDTDFDAESGDDIMVQGIGINRNNGMAGFDWTTFQNNDYAADADMNVSIFVNQQANILRDRYDLVEGLSGWNYDDTLRGRDVVLGAYDVNGNATQISPTAPIESFSNALLEKNVDLITGLREIVSHLERFEVRHPDGTTGEVEIGVMNTADASDIILGGAGSDMIEGRAGNDILDGDRYLNVRIGIADALGNAWATADKLVSQVFDLAGNVLFGGRTLETLLFAREVAASQLSIVREILDGGSEGDVDVAIFWDVRENYEVIGHADGSVTVTHLTATPDQIDSSTGKARELEGSDRLRNFEVLRFADGDVTVADAINPDSVAQGVPIILDVSPTENQAVTVDLSGITDADGIASTSLQWQASTDGGVTWTDIVGATSATFTPPLGTLGAQPQLRVAATVTDANGIVTTLVSSATDVVGEQISGSNGANTLTGGAGGDFIDGNSGNDVVNAGASDDVIVWNAANDGRDTIDGGTETVIGDTFIVNGTNLAETFRIYTVTEWQALGGNRNVAAGTEIVITRNGTTNASVIAELREIEEIVINTNGGGFLFDLDQVLVIGDFTGTSLSFNTITINGSEGDDAVDVSALSSAHRILFRTAGGHDMVVGALRAQDVIEAPAGVDPASYVASFDAATGLVTMSAEGSTITFSGSMDNLPTVVEQSGDGASHGNSGTDDDLDDDDNVEQPVAEPELAEGDIVSGTAFGDRLTGAAGVDFINGLAGADEIMGKGGDDVILAGADDDAVQGDAGDDIIDGEVGNDALFGGSGNDTFLTSNDDGRDLYFGGAGHDTIDLSGVTGDAKIDLGSLSAIGSIEIGAIIDRIISVENVIGGRGNDHIHASVSQNVMAGGEGSDTFTFNSVEAAHGDTILDFSPGDVIDLSAIDAVRGMSGNQSFTLSTDGAGPAAGLLMISEGDEGMSRIDGHVDGDGIADFSINVRHADHLTEDSFKL